MLFYLDETESQVAAVVARERGVDIISSHESGQDGSTDAVQLSFAASQGRCLVTRNYAHFYQLTTSFAEQGLPHAGVLCIPPSLPSNQFRAIAEALAHYAREHPDGIPPYTIDWLRRAPPEAG